MRLIHLTAGACAAALLGAVAGASIRTQPLERGNHAWDHIPRPDFGEDAAFEPSESQSLPNHYPLVTPQGRFEVAELRDRGLYRNRRFGSDDWIDDPEPAYEVAMADYRYLPEVEPDIAGTDDLSIRPDPGLRLSAAARALSDPRSPAPPTVQDRALEIAATEADELTPPPLAEPPALAEGARASHVPPEFAVR